MNSKEKHSLNNKNKLQLIHQSYNLWKLTQWVKASLKWQMS